MPFVHDCQCSSFLCASLVSQAAWLWLVLGKGFSSSASDADVSDVSQSWPIPLAGLQVVSVVLILPKLGVYVAYTDTSARHVTTAARRLAQSSCKVSQRLALLGTFPGGQVAFSWSYFLIFPWEVLGVRFLPWRVRSRLAFTARPLTVLPLLSLPWSHHLS